MTTRDPDLAESSRYVFGVFLIDEYFEGDQEECGYVISHSKWRIELKPDEAHQMLLTGIPIPTINKLYVTMTRSRGNLFLMKGSMFKKYKAAYLV